MFKNIHILILCFLIILTGCTNSGVKETNTNTTSKKPIIPPNSEGFVFKYNLENYETSEVNHYISNNESYKASIEIINYFSRITSFRVYFFLNSELIGVKHNNKVVKFLNYNSIKPEESLKKGFEIPNLKKGINDFVVVYVRNPDQTLDKEDYKEFINFGKKFTIISGDNFEKNLNIDKALSILNNPSTPNTQLTYLTFAGQKIEPQNALTYKKVNEKDLTLSLNFWNDSPNKYYSILLLDNDEQIPLENNLYVVKEKGNASLELNLKLNNEKVHNLVAVIVGESPEKTSDFQMETVLTTNKITIVN